MWLHCTLEMAVKLKEPAQPFWCYIPRLAISVSRLSAPHSRALTETRREIKRRDGPARPAG